MKNVIIFTSNRQVADDDYNAVLRMALKKALENHGFAFVAGRGAYFEDDDTDTLVKETVFIIDIEHAMETRGGDAMETIDFFRDLSLTFDQDFFIHVNEEGMAYSRGYSPIDDEFLGEAHKITFGQEAEPPYTMVPMMHGHEYWRFLTEREILAEQQNIEYPKDTPERRFMRRLDIESSQARTIHWY